jgi:stage III sporulation protein AH
MNKKQAGIILTLLALIVCAGILAARVNGPLEVTNDGYNEGSSVFNWGSKESASSNTDVFVAEKLNRQNSDAQTISTLKAIVDDKNVSEANKSDALKQYTMKTKQVDLQNQIEQQLRIKGFDEAICIIKADNTKANVIVKAKELTAQQRKVIQDVVTSTSGIKSVEIENKQ